MNRRIFAILALCAALPGAVSLKAAEVPRPGGEFPFVTAEGAPSNLTAYKGKVTVVEFLLVTCPHCQNTARVLSKLNGEYGKRGVQFQGISIQPNADVKSFIQSTGANFPVGNTRTQDQVYTYLQHSLMQGSFYVPQIVVIDRAGVIREQHGGTDPWLQQEEANLRTALNKILAEPAAGAKKTQATGSKSRKKAS